MIRLTVNGEAHEFPEDELVVVIGPARPVTTRVVTVQPLVGDAAVALDCPITAVEVTTIDRHPVRPEAPPCPRVST